ncbi:uncharacterized protein KQ657_002070 [Scheffersomyces spartinae]|uniref:PPM-type phosphatase domain-containing protein n=1 Tax=Scheffersomyces spartinae TaxID=45513 RepID=A0A9P7VD57_9ASCO|nr:uncharacterized protein KQ657_002070 [Scheffersomyces spartinae]KAG7195689.1 hypothetical protein KQ657_002070 [Scheffersomyces spartinae]
MLRKQFPLGQNTVRHVSSTITFTLVNRAPTIPILMVVPNALTKLKVPLLKSPLHLGHATSRVNRMYNEDRYSAQVLSLPNDRTVFNFGIYDGHGGDNCSEYISTHLPSKVERVDELCQVTAQQDKLFAAYRDNVGGYWKRWYKQKKNHVKTMKERCLDINLRQFPELENDLPLRLPMSYLETDYDFLLHTDNNDGGSTCTSVYLETIFSEPGDFKPVFEDYYFNRNTINVLTVAHVGDTKCILVDSEGLAHPLTQPHHPSNPNENERLRRFALALFMMDSFGEERLISLANTRAFGDVNFKEIGVSAEPEVTQLVIGDKLTIHKKLTKREIDNYTIGGGDESFLILCTDGVTDVLTDQEIADIAMANFNNRGHKVATPQFCAGEVIKFVEYVGGDDNATCLIVRLNGWGKWPTIDRTGSLRQDRLDNFQPKGRS